MEKSDGTEWYQIVAEQHSGGVKKTITTPEVISQYEWKKLGFQEVKETNPSADGYLNSGNMPSIFQEIYNKRDTGGENGSDKSDGKLQQSELKAALKDQEIREQWSKLIAYHPSEWKKDTAPLFARFEKLLTPPKDTPEDKKVAAKKLLEQEKERMSKLVFLEDIKPSIPVLLYHFHPVTFVEYINETSSLKLQLSTLIKLERFSYIVQQQRKGNIILLKILEVGIKDKAGVI